MMQEASGRARNTFCGFQGQQAAFHLCFPQQHMCDCGHSQPEDDADYYPRSCGVQMNNGAIPI